VTRHVIDPGLQRVGRAAVGRLERTGLTARGRVTLKSITDEEIGALSGLLGARWRTPLAGTDASVDLASLDQALQESGYRCTLLDLATALNDAPLVDRGAARRAAEVERRDGWQRLAEHDAVARRPALLEWLERERSTGAARRVATDGNPFGLLGRGLHLVVRLPAEPAQSLPRFAARWCGGDPHALDRDKPLDGVLLRALAVLDGDPGGPVGAAARRERYDRWGLICDELSGTVLCAGLRPSGDSMLDRSLRLAAAAGEPRVLTLRELRDVTALACGPVVFTCENPDVVAAAADALAADCPPLVCTEGWPSTACLRLLRALVAGGAVARHHGDLDHDGLRIVDHLLAATGGEPWRMGGVDVADHMAGGAEVDGDQITVVRDDRLFGVAQALQHCGRVVREEQMIDVLLADLRAARPQSACCT